MRIETHGQQIEVTPALRDYVETKLARLGRHFEQPLRRPDPAVPGQARTSRRGHRQRRRAHPACRRQCVDMYAAIDLLADKLDRLLMKHKEKQSTTTAARTRPGTATSPDPATGRHDGSRRLMPAGGRDRRHAFTGRPARGLPHWRPAPCELAPRELHSLRDHRCEPPDCEPPT